MIWKACVLTSECKSEILTARVFFTIQILIHAKHFTWKKDNGAKEIWNYPIVMIMYVRNNQNNLDIQYMYKGVITHEAATSL